MTEEAVVQWVTTYGYFGMFGLLIFGIIGLPIPDEWLLVLSGYLVFHNVLAYLPTVAVAAIGSATGLTISYVLGRTSGAYVLRRYGRWLSLDEAKIVYAQKRFERFGCWMLVVGPFVPGVRNLMGYLAGASKLRLDIFARFAYVGALISSVIFVTFGYLAGKHLNWNHSMFGVALAAVSIGVVGSGLPIRLARWMRRTPATPA